MKSLRFLERGKSRKAMEVMKVRRKSSYSMGTAKCMGIRRTGIIHSWGSINGHVDDRSGKLVTPQKYPRNFIIKIIIYSEYN